MVSPYGVAAYRQHRADAGHTTEDLRTLLSGEEFLEAVDGESVELGGIAHFAAEDGREVFESAEHTAADVDPRVNMFVDPFRASTAMTLSFRPGHEVENNLGAHTVRGQNNLLSRRKYRNFNV